MLQVDPNVAYGYIVGNIFKNHLCLSFDIIENKNKSIL